MTAQARTTAPRRAPYQAQAEALQRELVSTRSHYAHQERRAERAEAELSALDDMTPREMARRIAELETELEKAEKEASESAEMGATVDNLYREAVVSMLDAIKLGYIVVPADRQLEVRDLRRALDAAQEVLS